jgi:hypothetical protein
MAPVAADISNASANESGSISPSLQHEDHDDGTSGLYARQLGNLQGPPPAELPIADLRLPI